MPNGAPRDDDDEGDEPPSPPRGGRLVLVDELGGGTDPAAGGALAQSILESLLDASSPSCGIVVTTHSPRLKALGFDDADGRFRCAAVVMKDGTTPGYRLEYGTTGESHALAAAGRCDPPLPDRVLDRAADLLDGDGDGEGGETKFAAESLRRHLEATERDRAEARTTLEEVRVRRDDALAQCEAAATRLSRLESRLASIFDTLARERDDGDDAASAYVLVGDALEDLRLTRRHVRTEEERLARDGLRRVAESDALYEGQTVVIVAEGAWKGCDAIVAEAASDDPRRVTVVPAPNMFAADGGDEDPEALVLDRRDVAVFDCPPSWEVFDAVSPAASGAPSGDRRQSASKVLDVLSDLNVSNGRSVPSKTDNGANASFASARERKAAAAAAKSDTKKKKSKAKKRK